MVFRGLRRLALGMLLAGVAVVVANSCHAKAPAVKSDAEYTLRHDGRRRWYTVHVPANWDGRRPLAVVLNLHGGGGNAEITARQTRMNEVADRHGFIVVYPEGTGRLRRSLLTWNAGRCCAYAVDNNIDDVGFIGAVLDELPQHYPIDPRRVYATGISNGAMLCYRLACEMPERIAAIGPVSGAMGVDGPRPSRPVPIIHFHGLQDRNVPFAGGVGPNARLKVDHRSVPDTVAWWREVNRCNELPPEVIEREDVVIEHYHPNPGDSRPGAPIVVYALREGGHNWPGGVDVTAHLKTGKLVTTVDASTLMWEFFRQFSLDEADARR